MPASEVPWTAPDSATAPQAVEVFSGGGLFALALDIEGVIAQHHCELDPSAVETLRRSIDKDSVACDVTEYHPKAVPGGLDILSGGPPCQPWSQGGEQKGQHDARNLWPEIHRLIAESKPRIVLMENVHGILHKKHAPYLEWWWAEAARLGYVGVIWKILAADYGSPQRRGRTWFVLWPEGAPWGARLAQAPPPTHADPRKAEATGLLPWVRAFDRLNDGCCGGFGYTTCVNLGNLDRLCESCVQGGNYEEATNQSDGDDDELSETAKQYLQAQTDMTKHPPADAGGFFAWKDLVKGQRRTTGVYLAPTVTKGLTKSREHFMFGTREGSVAPTEGLGCPIDEWIPRLRPLSVREVAKLQSVPQWYQFHAAPGLSQEARVHAMKAQVGNGIDVNMGRAVVRHALGALGYEVPQPGSLADDQALSADDPAFRPQGLWPLYRIGACPELFGSRPQRSTDPALSAEQVQHILHPPLRTPQQESDPPMDTEATKLEAALRALSTYFSTLADDLGSGDVDTAGAKRSLRRALGAICPQIMLPVTTTATLPEPAGPPMKYVLGGHTYDLSTLDSFPYNEYLDESFGTQAERDRYMPEVFEQLTALRFPLKVYRGMGLPEGERPRVVQGGESGREGAAEKGSWTYDRATGVAFAAGREEGWGPRGDVPWLLEGVVQSPHDVDWPATVNFNLRFDTEREIVVKPRGVQQIRTTALAQKAPRPSYKTVAFTPGQLGFVREVVFDDEWVPEDPSVSPHWAMDQLIADRDRQAAMAGRRVSPHLADKVEAAAKLTIDATIEKLRRMQK